MNGLAKLVATITNLGDAYVLIPSSVGVAWVLFRAGASRDVRAFIVAIVAADAGTLAAKIAFAVCGREHQLFGVYSPSGHTAFATVFYGCVAIILQTGRRQARRRLIVSSATTIVASVALSRLLIRAHTLPEVLVGLLIGGSAAALFLTMRRQPAALPLDWRALNSAAPFLVLFVASLSQPVDHWTTESFIHAFAARLGDAAGLCR